MGSILIDTHVLVWFIVEPARLSAAATNSLNQSAADGDLIYFSAISLVELRYLIEKGRLSQTVLDRLLAALELSDTSLAVAPVSAATALTVGQIARSAVPDMPDRIIAATALQMSLPLITRDKKITASGINVIW